VSSAKSPLHNLATFLQKILRESLPISKSCKNSFDLINELRNIHILDNFGLVSLDVTSLFINVPIDVVLELLDNKWILI